MELAYSFPLDFFTNKDREIIRNFIEHKTSLFEFKSKDGKDILLEDSVSGKMFLVKTIDFPDVLENGDFLKATLVKKIDGDYFFYGNVSTYAKEDGLKMNNFILQNIDKIKKKKNLEVEWEIEYKN